MSACIVMLVIACSGLYFDTCWAQLAPSV